MSMVYLKVCIYKLQFSFFFGAKSFQNFFKALNIKLLTVCLLCIGGDQRANCTNLSEKEGNQLLNTCILKVITHTPLDIEHYTLKKQCLYSGAY